MNLNDLYSIGKDILKNANVENYAFDTKCLLKYCFNLSDKDLILFKKNNIDKIKQKEFLKLVNQRKLGRSLQYILGYWNFMGLNFKVGEGVLIPRDDTEIVVDEALNLVKNIKNPKILDLCAGAGTIALTMGKIRPDAKITAIELSDIALDYLHKNICLNNIKNIKIYKYNVLEKSNLSDFFDLIVSNPPYIPSNDIKKLQIEVQNEPLIALDGGQDGLKFYKHIVKNWLNNLKKSGFICFEIGINQTNSVINILDKYNIKKIKVTKDLNKIDRAISGIKI